MAGESDEVVKTETEEVLEADDKEEEKADEREIPVRKSAVRSNADFARERVALKGKKEPTEEEAEEQLTPQARKLIEAEVERRLQPLATDIETNLLVNQYLSENAEDKKYEKRAKQYLAAHPTLTVEDAFSLAGRKQAIDPEEKSKAVEKAKRAQIGGSQARKGEEKTVSTEKEMKDLYQRVKRGEAGTAKALGVN